MVAEVTALSGLVGFDGCYVTWGFARGLGGAQRHVGRFAGRQAAQGGGVGGAGLSLPPRHGSVADGHVQLQDTVDIVLKPELRHLLNSRFSHDLDTGSKERTQGVYIHLQ